ncbi:hypothetical protein G9A89_021777 [Geosiphon pyriformis]|nr:hypothetical protein G9A89_021777 [Geosiphon pyriformis]
MTQIHQKTTNEKSETSAVNPEVNYNAWENVNFTNEDQNAATNIQSIEYSGASNVALRHRKKPTPTNIPPLKPINAISIFKSKIEEARKFSQIQFSKHKGKINQRGLVLLILILCAGISSFWYFTLVNIKTDDARESADAPLQSFANMAESASGKLAELNIPVFGNQFSDFSMFLEMGVMNRHRFVFRDLAIIMKKSDVITNNGVLISDRLFDLAEDLRKAGDELGDFRHKASNFFFALNTEMAAIYDKFSALSRSETSLFSSFEIKFKLSEKFGMFGGQFHSSADDESYIQARLKVLEDMIPDFQGQLKRVMDSLDKIQDSAGFTREYLIDGEREAQKALERHWLGSIKNYNDRIRAEKELNQVRQVIELLKSMAVNLGDFDIFLKQYRLEIQDLKKQVRTNRMFIKPSKEALKYLSHCVKKLEENHRQFDRAENFMDREGSPSNQLYLDSDDLGTRHRDCAEFTILFEKPEAHLRNIRIWSSHAINAMAFFFTDDTVEIFGAPGNAIPRDFSWSKGERIERIISSFGSVIYGLEILTNKGRSSGWHGDQNSDHKKYLIWAPGNRLTGMHGSFSKYICSLGILSTADK